MTIIKNLVKRYPVWAYFVITFIFTWGCMALAVYPDGFPITDERMETAGALVYVAMLVGPGGAGLLLTGLLTGRKGFRDLLARLFRWRVSVRWYAVALLGVPLVIMTIILALSLMSPAFYPALFRAEGKAGVVLTAVTIGLVVGFFEELGWTGFAVPRLRQRYGVLATGLIVGLVWGAWHFPPFWKSDTFSAGLPILLLLAQLFSWLPPYRIVMVWVYGRTESLLITVLMHAGLLTGLNLFVPAELAGGTLMTWILSWAAVLWAVVTILTVSSRKRLARQPTQSQIA